MNERLRLPSLLGCSACAFILGVGVLSAPASRGGGAAQVGLASVVELGKKLFTDTTLSEPRGMACVTCHDPAAGFSYPASDTNEQLGAVPGVVKGRFGFRKPPSAAYAAYLPTGIPTYDPDVQAYVGGLFYDGRAADTVAQAKAPFLNPNEMNNLIHNVGSPQLVVRKVEFGPSGRLFREVFGERVFERPVSEVYDFVAKAISAFEKSTEVSPFTSKYDAYLAGLVQLSDQEMLGLRLATGTMNGRPGGFRYPLSAHCMDCHGLSYDLTKAPDLWTNSCYANLGVPKNPNNPYYKMTDRRSNPEGYNPLGDKFIDYGLGDFLYPLMGKPVADLVEHDPLAIDGAFKTPSLRNVDKRPYPGFVKSYMHNGFFKSLEDVVHFYNTRNLTTYPGEVIDFTQPNPYANLIGTPLWPPPEWPSPLTLINPQGLANDENYGTHGMGEQVGHLRLGQDGEAAIVAFLKTLTDGYMPIRAKRVP